MTWGSGPEAPGTAAPAPAPPGPTPHGPAWAFPPDLPQPLTTRTTRLPRPDVHDDDSDDVLEAYRRRVLTLDGAGALLASTVACLVRFGVEWPVRAVVLTALLPAAWLVVLTLRRAYEGRCAGSGIEEYRRTLTAGVVLFAGIAVVGFVTGSVVPRSWTATVVPLTVLCSLAGRARLRSRLVRLRRQGRGQRKVLVVGKADAAVAVIELLDNEPQHGLVAVGACIPPAGVRHSHVQGVPVVGEPDRILEAVDELGVHVVAVVSHPDVSGHALRRLAWALEERQVGLVVAADIVGVAGPRLSARPVAGLGLVQLDRPAPSGGRRLLKRGFDLAAGLSLLVVLAPLLAAVAVAVRTTSRGPVLFRQVRTGLGGREFTMYKFRSTVVDAPDGPDGPGGPDVSAGPGGPDAGADGAEILFKVGDDPRLTRVGARLRRYCLDELPQLVNVVRGDMSLVGPRPPLLLQAAAHDGEALRLAVRPGITGLAQVGGRPDLSWEDARLIDLRYVDGWSLTLDLAILWRTARAVLAGAPTS